MKKFRFRLEPLLKLKAYREKEEQKLHAAAYSRVISQENKLLTINFDRGNNQKRLVQFLAGNIDVSKLIGFSRYFLKLKKDELLGREMLKVFQKEAEEKRLKLLEATRQRKIFEKLKERHLEKYQKEYELLDQKNQDEVGLQIIRQKKDSRS